MSSTGQSSHFAIDGNGKQFVNMYPASHGTPRQLLLTIPAGARRKLTQAVDYPKAAAGVAAPELMSWTVQNTDGQHLHFGDETVTDATGIVLPGGGPTNPQFMSLGSDPDQQYIYNSGIADVTVVLLLIGKFYS